MLKLLLAVAAAVALRMMLAWSLTRHKPGRTRSATTSAAASSAPIPLVKPTWPSAWASGPAAPGGVSATDPHPQSGGDAAPTAGAGCDRSVGGAGPTSRRGGSGRGVGERGARMTIKSAIFYSTSVSLSRARSGRPFVELP